MKTQEQILDELIDGACKDIARYCIRVIMGVFLFGIGLGAFLVWLGTTLRK